MSKLPKIVAIAIWIMVALLLPFLRKPEILTRIGIFLEFCAGFLTAPGLIGARRLKKLERYSHSFFSDWSDAMERLGNDEPDSGLNNWSVKLVLTLFVAILYHGYMIFMFIYSKRTDDILQSLINSIVPSLIFATLMFGTFFITIAIITIIAPNVLHVLADDRRLRRTLISIGIPLLILAKMMQFIGTF